MPEPIWQPSDDRIEQTNMAHFMEALEEDWNITIGNFQELYRFSITQKERFWTSLNDFSGVIAETWGDEVLVDGDKMPGAKWFPGARLNFAENLLRRRDVADALVFWGEDRIRRRLTYAQFYDQVSSLAQALRAAGVKAGDRVGAIMSNVPEALVAMLATTSLGGVWSSCSPDFGVQGVLDRFGQIEPRVLFAVDGYLYNGKSHDIRAKLGQIMEALPSVEHVIIVPYVAEALSLDGLSGAVGLADFVDGLEPGDIDFQRLPFDHPLYILYSSGTTGAPKCIVHGAGGTLLQHLKEHMLLCDIKPDDRVFHFTTCGWMMWNWLASVLACQATLLLYDGAPFYPDGNVLFDYADAEGMTLFGTSAKFINAVSKAGLAPIDSHRLDTLKTMTSTGSPLVPEGYDFVYSKIKKDFHLVSMSGGTDIISCFVGANPIGPVWPGEIQAPALAMNVQVFDVDGRSIRGEKGELVCTEPFPSIPIGFWNDPGDVKYRAAYYEKFPGVWAQGDWVEFTEHGGMIIHGRSDATLNPGGVRIGTAEIYRQVEKLGEVVESIVVGQEWDNDTRIVLFVVLRDGLELDDDLAARIKKQVRAECSPRHVPAKIVQVADIPRTKSGKITELAVRDVLHGRKVKNKEALANPEALALYADIEELRS